MKILGLHRVCALFIVIGAACVEENAKWDPPVENAAGSTSTGQASMSTGMAQTGTTQTGVGSSTMETETHASSEPGSSTAAVDDGQIEVCLEMGLASCQMGNTVLCADLTDDALHCGECFNNCEAIGADKCKDGVCDCPGMDGRVCNGVCADTKDDPNACGEECLDCEALYGEGTECHDRECDVDRD